MTPQPVTQQLLNQSLSLMLSDENMLVVGNSEQNAERSSSTQEHNATSIEQPEELVLKTPEVMESNRNLWNEAGVGKLANKLARYAYFGDFVLAELVDTGK